MYYSIEEMLEMVNHPVNRKPCLKLLNDNEMLFKTVRGSTHNHQAWPGGYWDHIQEVMNLAIVDYKMLDSLRTFSFTLGEALLVLFLHDIEKPWSYEINSLGELVRKPELSTKSAQKYFRYRKLKELGILLTPEQKNAFEYVEGEGNDYSSNRRVMNKLAAFCHRQDSWSARGYYDRPLETGETWGTRQFKKPKTKTS